MNKLKKARLVQKRTKILRKQLDLRVKSNTKRNPSPYAKFSLHDKKNNEEKAALNACIVIPTYNEARNIARLLNRIFLCEKIQPYRKNGISLSVLVVDDNSPDKTAEIVKRYMEKNSKVFLLFREQKIGLGAAYIAGMTYAMSQFKPQVILEMDADLSHNPLDIFGMMLHIKRGSDFVIGSRYIPGGSIPHHWGIHRKFISGTANNLARILLNFKNVHDCTGGFRAMKVESLEKIDLNSLNVKGYSFQVSLLNAMMENQCKVSELPIEFNDRELGKSKMRLKDITEFASLVLKLAIQKRLPLKSKTTLVQTPTLMDKALNKPTAN
jgi:dolichol-phosphate mannosyltransferase